MLDKLKDMNEMRKQAGQIQAMLANEQVEAEDNGVKIIMSGNQEVLAITINPELNQEDQEKAIKNVINNAIKKVQHLMASKMMGSF